MNGLTHAVSTPASALATSATPYGSTHALGIPRLIAPPALRPVWGGSWLRTRGPVKAATGPRLGLVSGEPRAYPHAAMPIATVNGVRLYYEVAGSGPPLVLVHGFACGIRSWDLQVRALSRSRRVITYDVRGHGLSDAPADP